MNELYLRLRSAACCALGIGTAAAHLVSVDRATHSVSVLSCYGSGVGAFAAAVHPAPVGQATNRRVCCRSFGFVVGTVLDSLSQSVSSGVFIGAFGCWCSCRPALSDFAEDLALLALLPAFLTVSFDVADGGCFGANAIANCHNSLSGGPSYDQAGFLDG